MPDNFKSACERAHSDYNVTKVYAVVGDTGFIGAELLTEEHGWCHVYASKEELPGIRHGRFAPPIRSPFVRVLVTLIQKGRWIDAQEDEWDRQIAEDAKAGHLDEIAERARKQAREGKTRRI